MRSIPLPLETYADGGFNRLIRLTYLDLLTWTSGTGQAIVPENALGAATKTLPANVMVGRVIANVITAFTSSGGVITTLTFSLGDGGSATRFINAIDLKTVAQNASSNGIYTYSVADTIDAKATIVGQTLASLNAGLLEIYLELVDLNGLPLIKQP